MSDNANGETKESETKESDEDRLQVLFDLYAKMTAEMKGATASLSSFALRTRTTSPRSEALHKGPTLPTIAFDEAVCQHIAASTTTMGDPLLLPAAPALLLLIIPPSGVAGDAGVDGGPAT